MASNYPSGLDEFDPLTPGPSGSKQSQIIGGRSHAEHHNDLGDAVEAIQTELGTDPAGSSDTVKARIAAAETAISGKAASSHTHSQSDVTGLTAALADVDTRVPMPAVGEWLANGGYVTNVATNITNGGMRFWPMRLDRSFVTDQLTLYCGGAVGAEFEIGIYEPQQGGNLIGQFASHTLAAAGHPIIDAVSPFQIPIHFRFGILVKGATALTIGATPNSAFPSILGDGRKVWGRTGLSALPANTASTTSIGDIVGPCVSFRRSA